MNLLIIGNGGREHALAFACAKDPRVETIFVAPGNAGTAEESKCNNLALDSSDHSAVVQAVREHEVELVIVGPEAPLVAGLVDHLQANQIKVWGPTQFCAQMEGSKDFAKGFMKQHQIPTAAYQTFSNLEEAKAYVAAQGAPIVIKADGLAAGKGVVVAMTEAEANQALEDMLGAKKFGDASSQVVIEQFLQGEEASFICMINNEQILPFATSQDHKRIFEGDLGPNTGGMGAYSPAPVVTDEVHQKVMERVIKPVAKAMKDSGNPYQGFLYAGLMIDENQDPYVIEFNCRMGDPETQPILMRLESSLVELIEKGLSNELPSQANWNPNPALGVVLASKGYPETSSSGDEIHGLPNNEADLKVFHAGTKLNSGTIQTAGGRVLCVTALAESLSEAQARALAACGDISFTGMQYRRDIGYRAILRERS